MLRVQTTIYEICYNYVVSIALEALNGVLHIVLRPVDVVIADEAVVVLKFWIVEERVPAILLHVLFP